MIYYQTVAAEDGGSANASHDDTQYTVNGRLNGHTYSITMVTLSAHLPSIVTDPVTITLGKIIIVHLYGCSPHVYSNCCFIIILGAEPPPDAPILTMGDIGSTFVMFFWNHQFNVDTYTMEYHRLGGFQSHQTECGLTVHNDSVSVAGNITEYNLTGLEEDSRYSITITAMNMSGSSSSMQNVTTLQAGMYCY